MTSSSFEQVPDGQRLGTRRQKVIIEERRAARVQEQDALALDPAVIEIVEHSPKRLSRVRGIKRQSLLKKHPLDELIDALIPNAVPSAGIGCLEVEVALIIPGKLPPLPLKPRADGIVQDGERALAWAGRDGDAHDLSIVVRAEAPADEPPLCASRAIRGDDEVKALAQLVLLGADLAVCPRISVCRRPLVARARTIAVDVVGPQTTGRQALKGEVDRSGDVALGALEDLDAKASDDILVEGLPRDVALRGGNHEAGHMVAMAQDGKDPAEVRAQVTIHDEGVTAPRPHIAQKLAGDPHLVPAQRARNEVVALDEDAVPRACRLGA